jgi:hypothetical protein
MRPQSHVETPVDRVPRGTYDELRSVISKPTVVVDDPVATEYKTRLQDRTKISLWTQVLFCRIKTTPDV